MGNPLMEVLPAMGSKHLTRLRFTGPPPVRRAAHQARSACMHGDDGAASVLLCFYGHPVSHHGPALTPKLPAKGADPFPARLPDQILALVNRRYNGLFLWAVFERT